MQPTPRTTFRELRDLVDRQADFIVANQLPSGAIPWYEGGITDPWDHVEAAIALDMAGRYREAAAAYIWSRESQNLDGSWYSAYVNDRPEQWVRDTNFAAYIASGMWLNYMATGNMTFLREMWPTVEKGVDFALGLQRPTGEISWALSEKGNAWPGAILTSSCCIWRSLQNGVNIAEALGTPRPDWRAAAERLLKAIRESPELFDRMGENKRRYAMNWFYPVLTGVIADDKARRHIEREWDDLVIEGWGCRVAADEDVTAVAETGELIVALCVSGQHEKAGLLLDWTIRIQDDEPGFPRGMKLPEREECPGGERATWTSAALIMAIAAVSKA
jgi:hypothetical protein